MVSILNAMKRITRRLPKDPATKSPVEVTMPEVKLDYWITTARLLKAAGENLPFPWLKGAADLVLQVLEPLRLARTNQQDFNGLAQDIFETLRLIQDQATALNDQGPSHDSALEMKCERFAQVLEDMLTEFEAIKTETLKRSLAVWTTSTMQHLIQSYQYRLQKEVVLFNTSNVVDIYASVHRIEHALTTRLDAALPPRDKTLRPVLENYHPLLPGDLRVIQTNHLAPQDFESCVLYQGEKTWKTFRGEYAEERWLEEIKFYHTLRLQPNIRQLFGFTQSQDFLGLVFYEHSLPIHEAWAELEPIQRVFAEAQFYSAWNEALSSLSSDSSFWGLVDQKSRNGVRLADLGGMMWPRGRLSPQADRSGKMRVVLLSNSQGQVPACRYSFKFLSLALKCGPEWIHKLKNVPLSRWACSGSPENNLSRFYCLVDANACSVVRISEFAKAAKLLVRIKVSTLTGTLSRSTVHTSQFVHGIARYSSVTHIQLPAQSVPVVWTYHPVSDCISQCSPHNGYRISIPHDARAILFQGFCFPALINPWADFTMRHIPTIWRDTQSLFPRQLGSPKLEYEYPRFIFLRIQMDFLDPQLNSLFLFTCTQLHLSADGSFDPHRLFYFSLDPQGQSRLRESDLSRCGIFLTIGTCKVVHSKTLCDFSLQALTDVATEVAKSPDPPLMEFKPPFQGWPKHSQARCSSVDRYLKYPHSRMWRYQHSCHAVQPSHNVLCDLITQEECICSEAGKMLLSSGYATFTSRLEHAHKPYSRSRVDAPAQRKRQRAKSIDRACRVAKSISHWIALMDVTEMGQSELQTWYFEPSISDSIDSLGIAIGPNRSGITPWTVLVEPSQTERGRSRKR